MRGFFGFVPVFALYMAGIAVLAQGAPQEIPNPDACVIDREQGLGCAHGTILEEDGKPIRGIQVELIPTFKTGEAQWYATQRVWTDEMGRFNFNKMELGEYFVAVHRDQAPNARHPYATAYYPGVEVVENASRIRIVAFSQLMLAPLRLKKLEVATVAVNVIWPDGTRPARSNLLFHNPSYPNQGVIGDEAPQVDNGRGQFTLPKGFEYYARAKVDCDAGERIETRESRPVQIVKVADGSTPTELTFVLPGPPCELWHPQR